MCKFKSKRSSPFKLCKAAEYIGRFAGTDLPVAKILNDELPIDDEGMCIFHSRNVEWKLENNFHEWFDQLIAYICELDGAMYMMTSPPTLKEISFAGFYLIGKDYEMASGKIDTALKIKGLNLLDHLNWSFEDIYSADPIYFEGCNMEHIEMVMNGAVFMGELHFSGKTDIGRLSLNDTKIKGGLLMNQCTLSKYAEFGGMSVNNICQLTNVVFKTDAYFNAALFECEDIYIGNCNFFGRTEYIGCNFKGDVSIEECEFDKELNFTDAKFDMSLSLTGNTYDDNVQFISTSKNNKMFYGAVNFLFVDIEKEVNGRIIFDNVNYSYIVTTARKDLSDLERLNKVTIGSGCIKYRQQTSPILIKTNSINSNIAKELANSFTSYFTTTSGISLGVEFIDKSLHSIKIIYFTDENISLEEFNRRLKIAEENYWDFEIKDTSKLSNVEIAEQIDSYVSKIAILTKMSMLREQGLWERKETKKVLEVIHFNDTVIDDSKINITINIITDNRIKNISTMKIKKIVAKKGSQINFADHIEKVEFNPEKSPISSEEFEQLKKLLLLLTNEEITDLQEDVYNPNNDTINLTPYQNIKEKIDYFAVKHGTPIIQGLSASVIYDILKQFFGQ